MSRTALVTGASSGIGAAIVDHLLTEGWAVIGLSRSAPSQRSSQRSSALTHIACDLSDVEATAAALEGVPDIDALVHAAGVMHVGTLAKLDRDEGASMWRLHVDAAVQLVTALAPRLPDGGRVVLIGSRVAAGAPGRSQYAASKAAMVGLARSWAAELAPRAITVNVVAPGATDTPMLRDPARAGVPPRLPPIGRYVRPAEVAALTAFLLGDEAGSLTGQQIVVCGGASL